MNFSKMIVAYLLVCSGFASQAQQDTVKQTTAKFLIGGALELGGDRVAEIYFTSGSTQSVRAGQGGSLAVGLQLQPAKIERLLFRGTIGFKYVTTAADNVHIRLTRIPVILTANWMISEEVRISAGLSSHRNIRFKTDGIGQDVTFSGATGPIFEVAYKGIGLTYTIMSYKDQDNNRYSANAIGISLSGVFPQVR
jgi:hypothetical protein